MTQKQRTIHAMGILLVIASLSLVPQVLATEPANTPASTADPSSLVEVGDELLFSSDYVGAAEYYRLALEQVDTPVVILRYAFCLGEAGQYEQSLALYEDAMNADVPFRNTMMTIPGEEKWDTGHWLERLGNPEEAISHYTDALEEFPRSPTITYALAWGYSYLSNHEMAIRYFKETIKNDPLYIDVYGSLGSTLYTEGVNLHTALHYLNVFLLLNPNDTGADSLRDIRDDILNQLGH